MQKIGFAEALDSIVKSDPRYQRDAYVFLRDALDFTTKQQKKAKGTSIRHVSGPELLEGVRQYALKEFGIDALVVVTPWPEFHEVPALLRGRHPAPLFVDVRRAFERGSVERYEGIGL
jgi:hypothetical protein